MVIWVFPQGGTGLESLVDTLWVTSVSPCAVAVVLLVLLSLGLELVGLGLGPSWP